MRTALLVSLLIVACRPALSADATVTIPHPSRVALIASATQINQPTRVRNTLPPEALVDRAAILSLDDARVCVQLAMWVARNMSTRLRQRV